MTTEFIDLPTITATQRREIENIESLPNGVIIPIQFGVKPYLDCAVLGLHFVTQGRPQEKRLLFALPIEVAETVADHLHKSILAHINNNTDKGNSDST